jgi:hypothetical protein
MIKGNAGRECREASKELEIERRNKSKRTMRLDKSKEVQ